MATAAATATTKTKTAPAKPAKAVTSGENLKKARAARKAKPKHREWKVNPPGALADKVKSHVNALTKLVGRASRWTDDASNPVIDVPVLDALVTFGNELEALSEQGFMPTAGRRGGHFDAVPGMRVWLRPDALALVQAQIKDLDPAAEFYLSISNDPENKSQFVRLDGPGIECTPIGMISKKMLSATPLS